MDHAFHNSLMAREIAKKQSTHNTTCPEDPSNLNPKPSNLTGPEVCSRATTINAENMAEMGRPTIAAKCDLTILTMTS